VDWLGLTRRCLRLRRPRLRCLRLHMFQLALHPLATLNSLGIQQKRERSRTCTRNRDCYPRTLVGNRYHWSVTTPDSSVPADCWEGQRRCPIRDTFLAVRLPRPTGAAADYSGSQRRSDLRRVDRSPKFLRTPRSPARQTREVEVSPALLAPSCPVQEHATCQPSGFTIARYFAGGLQALAHPGSVVGRARASLPYSSTLGTCWFRTEKCSPPPRRRRDRAAWPCVAGRRAR
jgi:hypothetical protein